LQIKRSSNKQRLCEIESDVLMTATGREPNSRNLGCALPNPHTLHPTPYTLHPAPYTLHPKELVSRSNVATLDEMQPAKP